VTLAELEKTPGIIAWSERTIAAQKAKKGQSGNEKPQIMSVNAEGVSPLEQMESAMVSINADVAGEVLSRLRTEHWEFMERAVLKVLLRLGFGQDEDDLFHVGGSHDGGIDGIINQDKLGLDQIYVQSKRYKEGTGISRDTIASFIGTMDTKGVTKGVFITASHFTPEAYRAASENRSKQVILINGEELAQMMVQYQIGVTAIKTFTAYKIDENFFED
jgi:restriction system protein